MAADRTGRWEDVRRALGRLTGRVTSHALPAAQTGITASVRQVVSLRFEEAQTGARQAECQPFALVRGVPPPSALAGGGGIDLAAVVTVIGADRALTTSDTAVFAEQCRIAPAAVHAWTGERDTSGASSVHSAPVRFAEASAAEAPVIFVTPPVRPLPVVRAALPKPGREARPRWQLASASVRSGLAPVLRVPITCRRSAAPTGVAASAAFARERLLLAKGAEIPEADVALIGVFPHVPLAALRHLAVVPDGTALQILVRPEAAGRGTRVSTVTVVLGRQRSTGKLLQAVRRGLGPERP